MNFLPPEFITEVTILVSSIFEKGFWHVTHYVFRHHLLNLRYNILFLHERVVSMKSLWYNFLDPLLKYFAYNCSLESGSPFFPNFGSCTSSILGRTVFSLTSDKIIISSLEVAFIFKTLIFEGIAFLFNITCGFLTNRIYLLLFFRYFIDKMRIFVPNAVARRCSERKWSCSFLFSF